MVVSSCVSRSLLSLSSSLVVLVPLMSWTLMVRVMVGEHGGKFIVFSALCFCFSCCLLLL